MNKIQIILRQFCTALMLTAMLTIPALAASPIFSDVPEGTALQESVSYLIKRSVTNGTSADTFSPEVPITARQWAVMLCRAYGAEIHGENWREQSQNCVEYAYRRGWLNETAVQTPDTRLCRSSLLESGLRAAGVPVYDACLFPENESLSVSENIMRVGRELSLCVEGASAAEIATRGEAAQLLYAVLTRELTVEAPPAPVPLENWAGVNVNDYLLVPRQVPGPILAAFQDQGWTYAIDYDYLAELGRQRGISCVGCTSYGGKRIYVSEAASTLHEFGHFLDGQLGFPAEHERLYLAEAQNSGLRDYAKSNSREYFADFDGATLASWTKQAPGTCPHLAPKVFQEVICRRGNRWAATAAESGQ